MESRIRGNEIYGQQNDRTNDEKSLGFKRPDYRPIWKSVCGNVPNTNCCRHTTKIFQCYDRSSRFRQRRVNISFTEWAVLIQQLEKNLTPFKKKYSSINFKDLSQFISNYVHV